MLEAWTASHTVRDIVPSPDAILAAHRRSNAADGHNFKRNKLNVDCAPRVTDMRRKLWVDVSWLVNVVELMRW